MDKELKETVLKVAEYSNEEKKRNTRMVIVYFVLGIVGLISNLVMEILELSDNFLFGFLKGSTIGMAIAAMIMGILYASGTLNKVCAFKKRLLGEK